MSATADRSFLLALDQGTTSSRSIVFDREGRLRGVAQQEFPQHFPQAGWVEHDAEEIWQSQASTVVGALVAAGIRPNQLAAVGITNQRETVVLWDRATGRPVHRAIVWQDRRTADACAALRAQGHEARVAEVTGLLLDPYFSGTKLAWMLDRVDGLRARAERGELCFGTVDSWLAWKLTAGDRHVTDPSNAARTLLFDIRSGTWSDEMLALLRIPRAVLPEVVPSSGVVAEVSTSIGPRGVPLAGLIGDQQGALAGQACAAPGAAKCTFGTGCFLLQNTGTAPHPSSNRLLSTVAWKLGDAPIVYALEGSIFIGGAIVQWLRDGLGIIRSSDEVEALARSVPDTGGVILVPALAGLGAPQWDPAARGAILGLTRGSTAAHVARAALEGIAFQVADLLDAMQRDSGIRLDALRVDGGAAANDLLMQMVADMIQRPIIRPRVLETTALGAATMAGLAVGLWRSIEERASDEAAATVEPTMTPAACAARRERWRDAVARAGGWERGERS
ncbi:MAG TPA: glycerol kinase GlpK [Phycisphaerales bacterium]|nr:glycerol kinase GlpK [Phycisphaerales bacterium]HMP36677.1 glycerol kinase GlpK [Phycisphaerales bacterium]